MPNCLCSLFLEVVIAVVWLSVFLMTSKRKKVPKAPFEQGVNLPKAILKKHKSGSVAAAQGRKKATKQVEALPVTLACGTNYRL
jgi:uncharacterized membrane protein